MLNLIKDALLAVSIYGLIMLALFILSASSWAEILYDPHPKSNRPDISKPRVYIDHQGRAWEAREGTFRPDRGKPLPGAPKPVPQPDRPGHWDGQ